MDSQTLSLELAKHAKAIWKIQELSNGQRSVENGLHWQLDFTFKEDRSQVKKDNGPANLNVFRKFALFLLSKEPSQTSIKRKKAGRDDKFLLNILKSA